MGNNNNVCNCARKHTEKEICYTKRNRALSCDNMIIDNKKIHLVKVENKNIIEDYANLKQQYAELNTKYKLIQENSVAQIKLMINGLSKKKQSELRKLYNIEQLNNLTSKQILDIYKRFPNWFR